MKILITGGLGYIGSYFINILKEFDEFKVTVVDNCRFEQNPNFTSEYKNFSFVKEDVRKFNDMKKYYNSSDIIIPLAGLVGAPLCEKFPKEAVETNQTAIKEMVSCLSKNQSIIMPVSNSGYGVGQKNKFCDENSSLYPVSIYGKTKVEAEKHVVEFGNSISFRLATVFGVSPHRMRTDLMVNNFTLIAYQEKKLKLYEPNFRRNFVHISDVAKAFKFGIDNFSKMKNNIFNLGLDSANITKKELCEKIKNIHPKFDYEIIRGVKDPDQRDYFVSNEKVKKFGFQASYNLEQGINDLLKFYSANRNSK